MKQIYTNMIPLEIELIYNIILAVIAVGALITIKTK
jgi:hypothetical protein